MYLVHLSMNSHDGRLTDYIVCNVSTSNLAIISDDDSPADVSGCDAKFQCHKHDARCSNYPVLMQSCYLIDV